MQARKVLGLPIDPTTENAQKLASDLAQLQAHMYRTTLSVDLLDQNPDPGHTNYELNKFGLALAQAIKKDLRDHPSKDIIKFYVSLLEECWKQKNYELGARIHQGINDAITRDEVKLKEGQYDLPKEGFLKKNLREKINGFLSNIELWQELQNKTFLTPAASKKLYEDHLRTADLFVPSIQAVMNFNAIRLDNVKSILSDDKISYQDKYGRLTEIKKEILDELGFIKNIMSNGLPKHQVLHFSSLEKKFSKQLSLKLPPVRKSPEETLNDLLKLNEFLEPQKRQKNVKLKSQFIKAENFSPTLFQNKGEGQKREKRVHLKSAFRKDRGDASPKTTEPENNSLLSPKKK